MVDKHASDYMLTYRAGQVIFREGDKGRIMYVIREGVVRISKSVLDVEKTLDRLRKGDFFGEMALIEGLPRSATATAVTETKLQVIDEDGFTSLLGSGGPMALRILRELSARLREADRQIETLLLKDEEGRVVHTLTSLSTVYGRASRKGIKLSRTFTADEIGDLANVSTRTARKVLDELVEGGFIDADAGQITLLRPMDLKNFLSYLNWRSKAFR
jgi:CRP/FNR family transcriptional regulator, cyclic AMP receptor protein